MASTARPEDLARFLKETGVVVEVRTLDGKEESKPKEEKEKPKPKPSGVKPRQFLLLTLAICILTVPIVGVITPVFITARKQRDAADKGSKSLCVVPVAYDFDYAPANYSSRYIDNLNKACDEFWDSLDNGTAAMPGYLGVLMTMSNIDPLNLVSTLSVDLSFGGDITDSRGKLNVAHVSKNATLNVDFVNTAGSDVVIKQGDRGTQKSPKYTLQTIKSLFNYPFDKYSFDVVLQARLENPSIPAQFQILPILLTFQTGYVGWSIKVQQSASALDQIIEPNPEAFNAWLKKMESNNGTITTGTDTSSSTAAGSGANTLPWTTFTNATDSTNPNAVLIPDVAYAFGMNTDTILAFTVQLERTSYVQFFSIMILTGMWLITSFLVGYGIDACYLRPRAVTMSDAGLFTGLLFALPGIRNAMPFVPPIGVAIDMFGFIWLMMFLMLTAVQVSSRSVMLYVHPEPTLYDKLLKTEAYHAYMKQKLEEQEKKKKEEEAKKVKEEQQEQERLAATAKLG